MRLTLRENFVLLVENNPDDEELTLRAFKKHRLSKQVIVVHHGAEAIDFLFGLGQYANRDLELMPKVILLDLKLPKVSGIEVLRRIRNHEMTSLLPVVVFSSSIEPKDLFQCYQFGANSYIRKPVDLEQLDDLIGTFTRYWLLANESPII